MKARGTFMSHVSDTLAYLKLGKTLFGVLVKHTEQSLPQVRMSKRVRHVSPKCFTWLHLGSWGWGRLHSMLAAGQTAVSQSGVPAPWV